MAVGVGAKGGFRAWVVLPELRHWARADGRKRHYVRFSSGLEKFKAELHRVLAYPRWLARWRRRVRTTSLAEGFFRHLRRHLGRFPGCVDAPHSEQFLGCSIPA